MAKYVCTVCGYVYEGETLPADFKCPLCGVGADKFKKIEGEMTWLPSTSMAYTTAP